MLCVVLVPGARTQARRAVRFAGRTVGLIKPPPPVPPEPATFDELLKRARKGEAEAKAEMIWRFRAETLADVWKGLCADSQMDEFRLGLLMDLGRDEARAVLGDVMERSACYGGAAFDAALRTLFSVEELKEMALTLPGGADSVAFRLADEAPGGGDVAFRTAYLLQPRNQLPWVLSDRNRFQLALEHYGELTRAGRLNLLNGMRDSSTLRELLAEEADPGVQQQILYQMGDTDGLMANMDRDGAYAGNSFWQPWTYEKVMAEKYPESWLARGIRAYEGAWGQHYFGSEREAGYGRFPMWEPGSRAFDPDREIPAWQAFLRTWSRHPAADDAAYRLARCYEIKGDFREALRWLVRAAELPGGQMAHQARGRVVWILDASASEEQLQAYAGDPEMPDVVRHAAAYSLALRHLRAGRFEAALQQFHDLLARAGPESVLVVDGIPREPYRFVLRDQVEKTAELARLSGQPDPESQYALAALMYHSKGLFTNRLWSYGKGNDRFGGHAFVAMNGDMEPKLSEWAAGTSRYVQAYRAFARLENAPEEIAAKAAYSRALSLAQLLEMGTYMDLWRPQQEILAEAADLFERMVNRYPKEPLAADALLSLAYLHRDMGYFRRIIEEYPTSDAAVDARDMAFPQSGPHFGSTVPFRWIRPDEVPPAVAEWLRTPLASSPAEALRHGDALYVRFAPAPAKEEMKFNLTYTADGAIDVAVGPQFWRPVGLIRLDPGDRPVRIITP